MAFLACSRVSFSRKLKEDANEKGTLLGAPTVPQQEALWSRDVKGDGKLLPEPGASVRRNGVIQKAEGKEWKGLMERGIHRPRKGVTGEFFLGSSHWAATGRSKRLQFCWQQLGGPRDSTIVFLSLFRLRKSHLVTERNTYIKCDDCNTFLVWKEGQIITHALPDLRSSEPKCRHGVLIILSLAKIGQWKPTPKEK